jgi:hypothetical protein
MVAMLCMATIHVLIIMGVAEVLDEFLRFHTLDGKLADSIRRDDTSDPFSRTMADLLASAVFWAVQKRVCFFCSVCWIFCSFLMSSIFGHFSTVSLEERS